MNNFTQGTQRWLAFASRILGWRPSEFWAATPTELLGALQEPEMLNQAAVPSRDLIAQMLERDGHE